MEPIDNLLNTLREMDRSADAWSTFSFWPDASASIEIEESTIHYLQCGSSGDPILFLHGMPCSSFLWRKILPELCDLGQCYAPDLIGMGRSGTPDIEYTIEDHIRYVEAFIEKLALSNILLVVHGWGSVIGLDILARRPDLFRGVVICESHLRPIESFEQLALPVQEFFAELDNKKNLEEQVIEDNFIINSWFPRCVMNVLTSQEQVVYAQPFEKLERRKVLLQYVRELPMGEPDNPVTQRIARYADFLESSALPKLLLYAMPGFITPVDTIAWAKSRFQSTTVVEMPDSLHFVPETSPDRFSFAIREWCVKNSMG